MSLFDDKVCTVFIFCGYILDVLVDESDRVDGRPALRADHAEAIDDQTAGKHVGGNESSGSVTVSNGDGQLLESQMSRVEFFF